MRKINQAADMIIDSRIKQLLVFLTAFTLLALPLPSALAAGPTPNFVIQSAGPEISGLSAPQELAEILLDAGTQLAPDTEVRINTLTAEQLPIIAGPLPSFGRFSNGSALLGMDSGLIMSANANASGFAQSMNFQENISVQRDFSLPDADVTALKNLAVANGNSPAIFSTTSISFEIRPPKRGQGRFLSFEYSLLVTESGLLVENQWLGEIQEYNDVVGIFTGGSEVTNNCAVVPGTNNSLTMSALGVLPPSSSFSSSKATALANLELRIDDANRPPTTANGFAFPTGELVDIGYQTNPQWRVQFLSIPLTCSYDAINERNSNQPIPVTIVIANSLDPLAPPAVAIAGSSIRWSTRPVPDYPNIADRPISDPIIQPKAESSPSAPTRVRAKLAGKGAIEITWSRPKSLGTGKIKHYIVYRNSQKLNPPISANTFKFIDQRLDASQSYFYSVVAVSNIGASPKSSGTNSLFPKR